MHDDKRPVKERKGAGALGGILLAGGLLLAKFKTILALLAGFKWLLIAPKLLFSFGSLFLSIWFYAVWFGGWKIAVVFVLMILVHELGHYFTWRNFGVAVSLPTFIPGFGAFVTSPGGTPAQNVTASLAGPAFGIAAAMVCWGYALFNGEGAAGTARDHFWFACAYIGFFLNLLNLIPVPMLDGGAIAGAIDARLWFVGIALIGVWVFVFGVSTFGILILLLMIVTSVPRLIALWRGKIDPRGSGLTPGQRIATLIAYVALIVIGIAGAAATNAERSA
jgi:Zn-dependent protease